MELREDSIGQPIVCEPGRGVTEEMGYDLKRMPYCPNNGRECATRIRRLLGIVPVSEEYIVCAKGQIGGVRSEPNIPLEGTEL